MVRVSLERVARSFARPLPRPRSLAHRTGLPRPALEPALHGRGLATPRARGALLARPALLQARAPRRRRRVAPGLLILDAHHAARAPHLLGRAGRFDARERLRVPRG